MARTKFISTLFALAFAVGASTNIAQAVTIAAADLDYGISAKQSNAFNFDFTAETVWTAGSQRSTNGSVDASNQRAGRVFVDFQLTAAVIDAAKAQGAFVKLAFDVLSIGAGVAGVPYTDGLDLRYLGTSATDRTAGTLWNTAAVGGVDQADIVSTLSPTGTYTILLTNASVVANIASATAGTYISFGFTNSVGVLNAATPVGNSNAETYGFQLGRTNASYVLTVDAIPEPATATLGLLSIAGLLMRRRRMA